MSDAHTQAHTLDERLVATISSIFTSAGVPNTLWGNYLLTVYGVPTIVDGVAFVIPDESTKIALTSIRKAGFAGCLPGLGCPVLDGYRGNLPIEHWHIDDELVISVYRKSDVLWEISFSEGSLDILNASDERLPSAVPGRGRGRFPPEFGSVQIPHPVRYCEAVIMLLCRDNGTRSANYWMAILTYILEYVDETVLFDENSLGEAYKSFYRALKEGDFSRMYLLLDDLRSELTAKRPQLHRIENY
ncbi:uncharacterized protein N7511_011488 [Penicillium nucicola]|uniref:uncharacterized protein n=1 Tax=Penicillium nucicola TaxID=1850975 RepID=UPI00254582E6|nr:uncharacterized protein N7511_011488 [Penicillium nucicola]KAJ5742469.1 hypothetical protein N7511_011488 [Penicillium nucicola]